MIYLRSLVFHILFVLWVLIGPFLLLWTVFLPRKVLVKTCRFFFYGSRVLEKYVAGITYKIEGRENVPEGSEYIIAPKHQSTMETFILPLDLPDPAIIMKRELYMVPIFGWLLWKYGMIAVNRGAKRKAVAQVVDGAKECFADGRPILIFPQGTRVKAGDYKPYRYGLAKIYDELKVPVVPVAMNTGIFWGRRRFLMRPGVVTIRYLPPIEAGLEPLEMLKRLELAVEKESEELSLAVGGPATRELTEKDIKLSPWRRKEGKGRRK